MQRGNFMRLKSKEKRPPPFLALAPPIATHKECWTPNAHSFFFRSLFNGSPQLFFNK